MQSEVLFCHLDVLALTKLINYTGCMLKALISQFGDNYIRSSLSRDAEAEMAQMVMLTAPLSAIPREHREFILDALSERFLHYHWPLSASYEEFSMPLSVMVRLMEYPNATAKIVSALLNLEDFPLTFLVCGCQLFH
jgi:hypothetical protein